MDLEMLKKCRILNYNFGFLGETYIEIEKFDDCDLTLKEKYFSLKLPYYCSRNSHYYSTSLDELIFYYKTYHIDVQQILNTDFSKEIKIYLLFTLITHLINDTAKLIGLVYSYGCLRLNYLEKLKSMLQEQTDYFINLIFHEDIKLIKPVDEMLINNLLESTLELGIRTVREYSEMDHPIILLKSYFVYEEYFRNKDIYLAPLQGASIIPAMYISMSKILFHSNNSKYPRSYFYLRTSNYDNTHHLDLSVRDQVRILRNQLKNNAKIVLIDDNVGTGKTLRDLKKGLEAYFSDIMTCVIECRWEAKILNEEYPAFDLNEVDIITPLEYRYYKRFDEEIDYLNNNKDINKKYYENSFYSLDFVYNNHDFDEFISNSEINETNLKRLSNIVSKYKRINSI